MHLPSFKPIFQLSAIKSPSRGPSVLLRKNPRSLSLFATRRKDVTRYNVLNHFHGHWLCPNQNKTLSNPLTALQSHRQSHLRFADKNGLPAKVFHQHQVRSLHSSSAIDNSNIITPRNEEPSLEWQRTGKEYTEGPDQILPSTAIYTWHRDGAVRISTLGHGELAKKTPISVPTMFRNSVEKKPGRAALAVKRNGKWIKWTYEEYYRDVRNVAKAFIALGLQPNHSVCILGFNSPEWFIADLGAIMAGGIPAGIYTTNCPKSCAYIAQDSRANIYVVDDERQLSKVLQNRGVLPDLKAIVQYVGKPTCDICYSWQELLEFGAAQSDDELNKRLRHMAVNQACTLIYTSGTTGNPKGVMLSHDNLTWLTQETSLCANFEGDHEEVVSYLPLSHIAAQTADIYIPLFTQATVHFADPDALKGTLINTLKEVQPTKFVAVPRVWEKMYEKLREIGRANTGLKLKLGNWAKEQGTLYNERKLRGESSPETFQFKLAKALILSQIRKALGLSRSTLNISAAAPISVDILEYFMSLNIIIVEAYGLSECSGPHCMGVESLGRVRFGSIGMPLDSNATKLDKLIQNGQGEICLGGRHVCMGYLNQEKKTKNAIDNEGWLHTEDVGYVDQNGYVFITGRIKELLITAGGENVAPVPIEDNIKSVLPFISNAMVIGDKLKFLSVLITIKVLRDMRHTKLTHLYDTHFDENSNATGRYSILIL
ncbi:unnamed protein product [Orchesella dallaii]|uniref:long-chain-fatty-acid--CoA ligase n=1 Tax=Orchesella dallaii TaxID=48710 RepID=A0ABP1RCQ1_9HEXA